MTPCLNCHTHPVWLDKHDVTQAAKEAASE